MNLRNWKSFAETFLKSCEKKADSVVYQPVAPPAGARHYLHVYGYQ